MTTSAFLPRKRPRQARSEATVEALLTAATRVLSSDGLKGFNTNRVAEVAGVSVGSLYQYYPNKAALTAALIARTQTALADGLEARIAGLAGASLAEAIADLACMAVNQQYGEARLAAALDHEERHLPVPEIAEARLRMTAAVERLLERHRDEIATGLSPRAAADCLALSRAMVEADALAGSEPDPDLAARVCRALLGYLTLEAAAVIPGPYAR
jgi:AcrR family transcriptional regulator